MADRPAITPLMRGIIAVVVTGVVLLAGIGFAGSYTAVRTLALHKGFGWFANVFPIGVDAGIVVLLALDLLLTWFRIPFPLLRQAAWLLTAATIAFNAAAAWPDELGVGMHATIPVLFVVSVEAARHAVGRLADITADKHMEGVRLARWLLAPFPTFRLWRRMKLWELRSYEEVIRREQDRLTYRAHLRARYGPLWRRRAPVEAVLPLRLTRHGAPLRVAAVPASPGRSTVICTATLGRLTLPPRPTPAAVEDAPAALPAPAPAVEAPVMRAAQTPDTPQSHRPDDDTEFERHTDDALRLAGLSKAAAVRTVAEAHPDDAAPQIVQRLAQHGITVTAAYVRTELSRQRRRAAASSGTGYYP